MKEINVEKLYEIAKKDVIRLEQELHDLSELVLNNFDLKRFFEDLSIPVENKKNVFDKIVAKPSPVLKKLIYFLIESELIDELSWLTNEFSRTVSRNTKTKFAEVTSADKLSEVELKKVKAFLDKGIRLILKVDPGLIGGIRIMWEDGRFVDMSLDGGLRELKEAIVV